MGATRVLMTADAVGGVWENALELAAGLGHAGLEVVLAVMGPAPDRRQAEAARAAGAELVVSPYRLEWMHDPWDDVAEAGDWLLELERRRGCDLVHLNGYAHGALPFQAPKLVVGHSCVLSWWRAVKGETPPALLDHYRGVVAEGLARADRVVAPTRTMLTWLQASYGPLGRTEVIYNGRSARAFAPAEKAPFVLCAGRLWDEAKNAGMLARVAGDLPWPVRIAGAAAPADSSSDATVIALAGATLLGALAPEGLARLYAEASIYASPARYEPFGLAVLEAALSGCALVLSDLPSFRELWRGAALFFPADDAAALEAALRTLIDEPSLRATLGRRARRRALVYSSRRMVRRYLALYRNLLTPAAEVRSSCAS
jgi:glycosyltransferase involved in cell wall biosynthesis